MFSDGLFKNGIQQTIKLQSQTTTTPIYFYYYKFPAEYGMGQMLSNTNSRWGVAHGDEIFTVFDNLLRSSQNAFTEDEIKMQSELLDFYESFLNNR